MNEKEKKGIPSSDKALAQYLQQCNGDELYSLIRLLKSRLCSTSVRMGERYPSVDEIPAAGTASRAELTGEIVELLGWYGSNAVAYGWRRLAGGAAGKPYLGTLRDVVGLWNKRLAKKDRKPVPMAAGVSDLETALVEILVSLRFHKKTSAEIIQILEESGLEKHVAEEVAKRYGPAGIAGLSLPILTKLLGKKTVMAIIQQLTVAVVGRFVGREAAELMVRRTALKIAQKRLTMLVNWIGWILLTLDMVSFLSSPARRVTMKAVPFIALVRVCDRLEKGENP